MNKEIILGFLNNTGALGILGKSSSLFKNNFHFLDASLKVHEKNKEVVATEDEIKNILSSLKTLEDLVISIPLMQDFVGFSINYCEMVSDWNAKIVRNNDISRACNVIIRLCNYHLSSVEAIFVLKNLISQAKKASQCGLSYVQLSKDYLNMIYEQLGKDSE
jgi:hypothetical protein